MTPKSKRIRRTIEPEETIEAMNWSHEQTMKFIELFKVHEHLWYRGHPDYRKGAHRQASLNEISTELNVPVKELTLKIHRMQSRFCGFRRKLMSMTPEEAANTPVNWPYFEEMRFMEKTYVIFDQEKAQKKRTKGRSKSRRARPKKPTARVARDEESEFDGFAKVEHVEPDCIISDDEDELSDDCYIACSSNTTQANANYTPSNNMKYDAERMMPTSTTIVAPPIPTMSTTTALSNDRIDAFFKAMADTVKSFPNKSIAEAKLRISQIVGEMELSLATDEEVLVSSFWHARTHGRHRQISILIFRFNFNSNFFSRKMIRFIYLTSSHV